MGLMLIQFRPSESSKMCLVSKQVGNMVRRSTIFLQKYIVTDWEVGLWMKRLPHKMEFGSSEFT